MAVLSDHRYMRSDFAFLTDGMETLGILLALTSKSVYSLSRSMSPLMANQSTLAGKKQKFYGTAHVGSILLHNMEPCDCRNSLDSYFYNKKTPIVFFFFMNSSSSVSHALI